jgi:hypothetical protein
MRAAPGRAAAGAALLLPLLLTACQETPPRPAGETPAVELGPVIRLVEVPTSNERVRALIDDAGLAHVLVASPGDRTLRHVVVDAAGAIRIADVVRSDLKPASLDAVFDAAGRLHVLAGTLHLVRDPAGQWSEAATPWAAAGLEAGTARFVTGGAPGGPLLYAFNVGGKALGAPARWDFYGVGGYGGGIIWPWRTRGSRLAVVAEDGGRYDSWSVVDLDDNEDVADWSAVASPDGRVHVVYDAQRSVLALQSLARYACIEPLSADDATQWREIAGRRVRSVDGTDMSVAPGQPGIGPAAALSFNPSTNELLLVRPHDGGRVLRDDA